MEKVLIIAYNDLNNSGVPNVIYQTIKALHGQFSFDVLIFGNDDYYYQKLRNEGIDINLIKYLDKKPRSKIARIFWWYFKRPHNHYVFMKQFLEKNKYLIIHSFKEYDCWPFFKAAKEAGVKKRIFHCNVNLAVHRTLKNKLLFDRNKKLSLKYSTLLVGVSELSCKNAFGNKEYIVLYNSYDEQKYNMGVKNLLSDDELVITQVASFNENKNQLFSLQILKELKKLYSKVKINLVGADEVNAYYKNLVSYAKTNDIEDDVSFIMKTDNVVKIYERTTFAILPSFSEGLPLTAMEAQACGINIFSSTNVTHEVDVGGAHYLDLSKGPNYWAECIYKFFLKQRNARIDFNSKKFSFERFKKLLTNIYQSK